MTDDPIEYTADDEAGLMDAIEGAFDSFGGGYPTRMRVTAQVEWSGDTDRRNNGVRTTKLDGLNLAPVVDALNEARPARERAGSATPAVSYTAQSWHAQIRALAESARGSDAADRAGLDVKERTLIGWLSESQTPNRANQQKIAAAYDELRNWNVRNAEAARDAATHGVADAVTAAIRQRYGAEVRLRNISNLTLE